jgi:hypothetical protein
MKRTVSVFVLLVAALCIAPPARAQTAPAAPTPETAPAQPAPPPAGYPPPPPTGYPPPPPRYPSGGGYPGNPPPSYWAPAQPRQWGTYPGVSGVYRPFSFTIGIGPGYLRGPDETSDIGLSYNLFRLGFGVVPNVSVMLEFQGTGTNSISPLTDEYSWLKQENWLIGLQVHFLRRLYVRGGVGAGFVSEHTATTDVSGPGAGLALAGAIGYEFVQTPHVALGVDLNGSVTNYGRAADGGREVWGTTGLNLAVSFY